MQRKGNTGNGCLIGKAISVGMWKSITLWISQDHPGHRFQMTQCQEGTRACCYNPLHMSFFHPSHTAIGAGLQNRPKMYQTQTETVSISSCTVHIPCKILSRSLLRHKSGQALVEGTFCYTRTHLGHGVPPFVGLNVPPFPGDRITLHLGRCQWNPNQRLWQNWRRVPLGCLEDWDLLLQLLGEWVGRPPSLQGFLAQTWTAGSEQCHWRAFLLTSFWTLDGQ